MMRRSSLSGTTATLAGLVCAMAGTPGVRADDAAEAAGLWWQIRRADVDSADFKDAQSKLTALTGAMPAAKRTAVAAAMMDPQAEPVVNAEALRRFGKDPLPITDIQRILWDAERSYQQRVLLKTYYSFCRAEARTSILSETTRRQLVAVLAERLENLVGAKMSYGEQRLLTHLCSHVLSRYGRAAKSVPQAKGLIAALEKYVEKADPADGFGAAIPVWLDLTHSSGAEIDTFGKAVHALGHWDPLVRWNATSRLGEEDVPVDDKAAQVVVSLFTDPRDEVRAARRGCSRWPRTIGRTSSFRKWSGCSRTIEASSCRRPPPRRSSHAGARPKARSTSCWPRWTTRRERWGPTGRPAYCWSWPSSSRPPRSSRRRIS